MSAAFSTRLPTALAGETGFFETAQTEFQRCGGQPRHETNGTCDFGRERGADFFGDQHDFRVLSAIGQRFMDVLRRPHDGAAQRRAGAALGTILLPTLSKHSANQDTEQFSALLDWGLRLCMLLMLPAAVGLAVLSFLLVATLFMYREFTLFDAQMTQHALIAYSFGLIGLIMIKVLASGFYARQNIKTPVEIAIFTLICTQLMNLAFIGPLKHVGLSLAIGPGACINAGLLFYLLRRHGIYQPGKGWAAFFAKCCSRSP